jgi:hypothetical protein
VARRTQPRRSTSVSDDWRSWLPERKDVVFRARKLELESDFGMLSVALNEALEFRHCGRVSKSWQAVCITPALCQRTASSLCALLFTMEEHAKHYGTVPNAAPLDAANFRGTRDQRSAKFNEMMSHVLLTQRSQFLYKIRALEDMVQNLKEEFCASAEELAHGEAADPELQWCTLDSAHFDLNTCLQETIVILKSFLVVLPEDQILMFNNAVRSLQGPDRRQASSSDSTLRWYHRRRTAQVVGK